jgi:hypothetical protein
MKRIQWPVITMLSLTIFMACNSGEETEATDKAAPNSPAVQNVNGNIPDSGNSINLNNPLPVDSSRVKADSLKK